MSRTLAAVVLAFFALVSSSPAQDGAPQRPGRIVRVHEREVLKRVTQRLEWDKSMIDSTVDVSVRPGGVVVLKGTMLGEKAKRRALEVVEDTIGVTSVVDELAVVKEIKIINAPPTRAVEVSETIVVPAGTKVIVKP